MSNNLEVLQEQSQQINPNIFQKLRRKVAAVTLLGAAVLAGAGCTTPAPGGGGNGNTYPNDTDNPNTSTWITGDSLSYWTGTRMNNTFNVGVGSSGFLMPDITMFRTIPGNTEFSLNATGATPPRMVVIGGVNDLNNGFSADNELLPAQIAFHDDMESRGIDVRFVVEPGWNQNAELDRNGAILKALYPDTIDNCDEPVEALGTQDGVHPAGDARFAQGYIVLANCIQTELLKG